MDTFTSTKSLKHTVAYTMTASIASPRRVSVHVGSVDIIATHPQLGAMTTTNHTLSPIVDEAMLIDKSSQAFGVENTMSNEMHHNDESVLQTPLGWINDNSHENGAAVPSCSVPCDTGNPPIHEMSIPPVASDERRHFLEGIQIDRCDNVLQIPDPPSIMETLPEYELASSTSEDGPLREITNENSHLQFVPSSGHESPVSEQATDDVSVSNEYEEARGTYKRARRSSLASAPPATDSSRWEEGRHLNVDQFNVSKRPKRHNCYVRQTCLDTDRLAGSQGAPHLRSTNASDSRPDSRCAPSRFNFEALGSHLSRIRKLVHSYTSLQPHQLRSCEQIEKIRQLTGYTVTPPATDTANQLKLERSKESTLQLMTTYRPMLKRMDAGKINATRMAERVTQCRAEKWRGRYRYRHIPTGVHVDPWDYEERYLCMLAEIHQVRGKMWEDHFVGLRSCPSNYHMTYSEYATTMQDELNYSCNETIECNRNSPV